jgi:hypothetical protein
MLPAMKAPVGISTRSLGSGVCLGALSSAPAALADAEPLADALGAPVAFADELPPRPHALSSRNKEKSWPGRDINQPDHRAFGHTRQAFARMPAVPRFTPAQLLPLLDCPPSEVPARAAALRGVASTDLVERILALRERGRALEPKPTSEELCLGLLSLLALDGERR